MLKITDKKFLAQLEKSLEEYKKLPEWLRRRDTRKGITWE